jgi:hypothetical protein
VKVVTGRVCAQGAPAGQARTILTVVTTRALANRFVFMIVTSLLHARELLDLTERIDDACDVAHQRARRVGHLFTDAIAL